MYIIQLFIIYIKYIIYISVINYLLYFKKEFLFKINKYAYNILNYLFIINFNYIWQNLFN